MPQVFETNAAVNAVRECPRPVSLADVLRGVFTAGLCDFCGGEGRQYPDPGTGFRFCLPCLEAEIENKEIENNRRGLSMTDPVED